MISSYDYYYYSNSALKSRMSYCSNNSIFLIKNHSRLYTTCVVFQRLYTGWKRCFQCFQPIHVVAGRNGTIFYYYTREKKYHIKRKDKARNFARRFHSFQPRRESAGSTGSI